MKPCFSDARAVECRLLVYCSSGVWAASLSRVLQDRLGRDAVDGVVLSCVSVLDLAERMAAAPWSVVLVEWERHNPRNRLLSLDRLVCRFPRIRTALLAPDLDARRVALVREFGIFHVVRHTRDLPALADAFLRRVQRVRQERGEAVRGGSLLEEIEASLPWGLGGRG